ncbi:MAG: hypothetical protein IPH42_08380 [Bacteroidetes bacterium]|nr:hypothetical protein [Bacteroidota bacterium]
MTSKLFYIRSMFKKSAVIISGMLLMFSACSKDAGIGGEASIYGKVYALHYNSTFTVLLSEYYVPDTYVYLVYGDDINYGTRIKTNYNGEFEFNYLYPGDYTIYTYSIDSAAIVNFAVDPPNMAVIQQVFIEEKKSETEIGDLLIYQ